MSPTVPTVIIGTSIPLRERLSAILAPLDFLVVGSKTSLNEIGPEYFPASGFSLLIIECSDDADQLIYQIIAVKHQNPLIRIVLLGHQWQPPEIAAAFHAGVNAYFAEGMASEEFVRAILIIMGHQAVLPIGLNTSLLRGHEGVHRDGKV